MNSNQLGIFSDMSLLPSGNPKIRKTFKKAIAAKSNIQQPLVWQRNGNKFIIQSFIIQ